MGEVADGDDGALELLSGALFTIIGIAGWAMRAATRQARH
jgi:hypothetical protein